MINEFQFLETDAQKVNRKLPLPRVSRKFFEAESGAKISVLHFSENQQDVSKQPYIFLHGAGLNAHTFDPTILALAAEAYSIDLPGHGKSDWREDGDYSPFAIAADVGSVIKQISSAPVTLVGHSLGGLTGAEIVAENPELVNKLVIIDITPGLQPSRDAGSVTEFIIGQKEFNDIDEIIDRAIAFGIGEDREALRRGITLNTRTNSAGKLEWTHHLAHLDGLAASKPKTKLQTNPYVKLWDPLTGLRNSVALIQGTQGFVSDDMTAEWHSHLPEATVVTIAGGHNLHEHNPIKLAAAIAKFNANEAI